MKNGSSFRTSHRKMTAAMSGILVNVFSSTTHQIRELYSGRAAKSIATAPPKIKQTSHFTFLDSRNDDKLLLSNGQCNWSVNAKIGCTTKH